MRLVANRNDFVQGNSEAACAVFDAALQSEKLKEDSRALAVLYIQYSRFLDQVREMGTVDICFNCGYFGLLGRLARIAFTQVSLPCRF